uniref:Small glutamine-rich tetratricopeptide repeat-containing protein beta n=1 Tax=Oryzias sinensis TaxID=183150 RepID=A0A8C7YRQ5_9TELE
MAVEKRLALAVVQFLRDQTHCGALNSDEQESLEVAIQCLETTFKISSSDGHLAVSQPLREIFLNALLKNGNSTSPETPPSPEDMERAEQLKNEGNNHMKEENYRCALDCYTQAIDLDLRNAVYYCNRAAAHSKLGNYTEATSDCERAIGIDPTYSKAYGRMGLALTAMNKYPEAISYFKKALVLDPDNDTYKSNLKIAEQKQREASSPIAAGLGFDMASLINNPAFISMVRALVRFLNISERRHELELRLLLLSAGGERDAEPAGATTHVRNDVQRGQGSWCRSGGNVGHFQLD